MQVNNKNERFILIFFVFASELIAVCAVPYSPCPRLFRYEYDGQQWIGVAEVNPEVYNRFRYTRKITMTLQFLISGSISNIQNYGSVELYHSIIETNSRIAARRSIIYRINFPTRSLTPILLKITVNDMSICSNLMQQPNVYGVVIHFSHTFYLPTIQAINFEISRQFSDQFYDITPSPPKSTNHFVNSPEVISAMNPALLSEEMKRNPLMIDLLKSERATACGQQDEQFRFTHLMSGGDKISLGSWPWLVAIYLKVSTGVRFQCTGSLISHKIVLTAAHCFQLYSQENIVEADEILLAIGLYNLRNWSERDAVLSDAEQIVLHSDYMRTETGFSYDADIAIVVVKNEVNYNAKIKPICLWPAFDDENNTDITGLEGTLVGWRQPYENEDEKVNAPRKLSMPIVEGQLCVLRNQLMNGANYRTDRVLCARSLDENGPCNGDSGGGLAIWQNGAWCLRGIVSAALGDPILNRCALNQFVIFTDVVKFRAWIDKYL